MTARTDNELDFTVDIYDDGGNVIRPLARLAEWDLGQKAYHMMATKYPDECVVLRHGARCIRASDREQP